MLDSLPLSTETVFSTSMPPRPSEIPRKEFDELARKANETRKDLRRVEADLSEAKNKLTGIEKKLESVISKRTFWVAAPLAITLIGIFVVRDSYQRGSKDRSLEDSINSLQRSVVGYGEQMGKSNERIARLESTIDVLLKTLLKDAATGTPAQVKTKLGVAEEFLKEAKERKAFLDPAILKDSGIDLLNQDAIFDNKDLAPVAWNVAYQYADYQALLSGKVIEPITAGEVIRVDVLIPEGKHYVYQNSLFEDATVVVDRGTFKNNVFRNCVIVYAGGPTDLDSNQFIETKIRPVRSERGRQFLKSFLLGTTIRTGPPLHQN